MLLLLHKGCSGRRRFFSGPTTSTATGCLCVPVCFFTCCACLALSVSLPDDAAASRSSPTALNNVVHKTGLRTARIELHAHLEFTVACPPVALSAHRTVAIAAASRVATTAAAPAEAAATLPASSGGGAVPAFLSARKQQKSFDSDNCLLDSTRLPRQLELNDDD